METSEVGEVESASLESISLAELNRQAADGQWPRAWLAYAAADLPNLRSALLAVNNGSALQPAALWPHSQSNLEQLSELLETCVEKSQAIVMPQEQDGALGIAFPILKQGQVQAIFACQLAQPPQNIEALMSGLEKSSLWLQHHFGQHQDQQQLAVVARQRQVIDSFTAIGKGEALNESALHWVDSLARNYQCDRVSLGQVNNGKAELQVISGSSDHVLNSQTTKQLQLAMQEACDQRQAICWPPLVGSDQALICLQTEKLSIAHHNASLLTVPVVQHDEIYLCLLFERPAANSFVSEEVEQLESHLALAGIAYETKREAVYTPVQVLRRSLRQQLDRLLGTGYLKRKLLAITVVVMTLFFSLVDGHYQINAESELEPGQIRIVSAPFNGYLKSSQVRAGDRVEADQVLVEMEDRELRLEKIKSFSALSRANKQYSEALAARDRAKAQIFNAQMDQSKARLAAAESQLQRSIIKSPFPALLVSGDLRQRIGGSVNQGEELFRLSPMNGYRLVLFVSEFKINDIALNQRGRVVLSAMPGKSFEFQITTITPITEVRDGGTVFRVEANLNAADNKFRPGMIGIAKVSVGQRLLISIWTEDLRKWLSLKLWSLWG